ncbi:uncharacterized protein LOC118465629 isoform X2 [Anopheles albimanus]|uniref:uncharacterized protein LOC118465629 isoform X2 n=1 Tax=Anopheles albimanus TaxID=7167 RepID=UPI0016409606|nr:uncharacterized protein LOC118465629 isoform X2 [Anopheles albimanus]XP_035789926.1 uncharacterized protein LOC118465629 isoform X2 [Anopheles albimanus]
MLLTPLSRTHTKEIPWESFSSIIVYVRCWQEVPAQASDNKGVWRCGSVRPAAQNDYVRIMQMLPSKLPPSSARQQMIRLPGGTERVIPWQGQAAAHAVLWTPAPEDGCARELELRDALS